MPTATLTIPIAFPSLNVSLRQHWSKRRRFFHQTGLLIASSLQHIGSANLPHGVPVRVHVHRAGWNLLDEDNLAGGAKPLVDGLTNAGVLVDDSPKWATLQYSQSVDRKNQHTTITLEW
jgi:hypothetical protein